MLSRPEEFQQDILAVQGGTHHLHGSGGDDREHCRGVARPLDDLAGLVVPLTEPLLYGPDLLRGQPREEGRGGQQPPLVGDRTVKLWLNVDRLHRRGASCHVIPGARRWGPGYGRLAGDPAAASPAKYPALVMEMPGRAVVVKSVEPREHRRHGHSARLFRRAAGSTLSKLEYVWRGQG